MTSFLLEVLQNISQKHESFEDLIFILPSKRAGTFLRKSIANTSTKTAFAPEIYSIETFVEQISQLKYATNTQQVFELYGVYSKDNSKQKDNFFTFSKWAQTLLQDINEIDRYLIDSTKLFSNLSAIQEINHWSLQDEKTQMMQDYLSFWNNLEQLYADFNNALLLQNIGHQGLVYRQACDKIHDYIESTKSQKHIFIGFNALNTAEEFIIQTLLKETNSDIYWDIDSHFFNDHIHDAGLFIRQHANSWPYFKENEFKSIGDHFLKEKRIQITGVPKNISQAKYVGKLLDKLNNSATTSLVNTAVVLGDENLLNPVLHSIPQTINAVNVTMGYSLSKTTLSNLFTQFIELYLHRDKRGWFYQPILAFLSHPYIKELINNDEKEQQTTLASVIKHNNWTHITVSKINQSNTTDVNLAMLFHEAQPTTTELITYCLNIIETLKQKFITRKNDLSLEYLYRFHVLFTQIAELIAKYPFVNDLQSLQSLYKELLSSETVDFQGDPLKGLQVMGMLESRNLDFETVIITSVNEGILPSGKSNNSFIPFDLKKAIGLPTYKEKDAVYTYHFYRLLQRAKNIYIIYNTEPDVLEGREKSRLIAQLLTDSKISENISHTVLSPTITTETKKLDYIEKSNELLTLIKNHANKGFSPTSLSNYIRNPLDFYKRNLLHIDNLTAVEETVAANTFGTIIHDTLEEIYTPFIGKYLSADELSKVRVKIKPLVKRHFAKSYLDGDISHGKNLIAFQVATRYIENFLNIEIKDAKKHQIKIIGLEQNLRAELKVPGLDFPIALRGKLDRIDEKDGIIRIIDYKTGKVENKNVLIYNWKELTTEYDYSKAFQLLCYALMYNDIHSITNIEAGIISFKNLSEGLLKFGTKPTVSSRQKDHQITQETLSLFREELTQLIIEICNPKIPFTEKEV